MLAIQSSTFHIYTQIILTSKSSGFFENQLYEILQSALGVNRHQKAGFLGPISSKIRVMKEMERRKRKSAEGERRSEKKKMVALLVFIVASLEKKKLLAAKGP